MRAVSVVPSGLGALFERVPGVETPGHSQTCSPADALSEAIEMTDHRSQRSRDNIRNWHAAPDGAWLALTAPRAIDMALLTELPRPVHSSHSSENSENPKTNHNLSRVRGSAGSGSNYLPLCGRGGQVNSEDGPFPLPSHHLVVGRGRKRIGL